MIQPIQNGTLFVVATPIGNLRDITYRAIDTLTQVNLIAAEDTRHTKKLLHHYGITTPCIAVHEHNERQVSESLIEKLKSGLSIALVSDAGTPLISDPGYTLIKTVQQADCLIVPIPGASAVITALSVAGLPTDRFCFEGFLPAKTIARQNCLRSLVNEPRTLIFYESPHRILATLKDFQAIFGSSRFMVLARELTKVFETIYGDSVGKLVTWVESQENQQKGEMVLLVRGAETVDHSDDAEIDSWLALLIAELPVKTASTIVAQQLGLKKNQCYKRALVLLEKK